MKNGFLFSIIIPTRDRPEYLEKVLYSLSCQTYKNFEVIVSDNFVTKSAEQVCDVFKDKLNLVRVVPSTPLSMPDNYEFALSHASGDYIYVGEDKIALYDFALEQAAKIIEQTHMDLVTFDVDGFKIKDGSSDYMTGELRLHYYIKKTQQYSAKKILKIYTDQKISYENLATTYFRYGKILFSFIKRPVFENIRLKFSRIFFPISLDFTSLVLILSQDVRCLHVGHSYGLYLDAPKFSTGNLARSSHMQAIKITKELLGIHNRQLPLPEFPSSLSNLIASDYWYTSQLLQKKYTINNSHLIMRVYEDLLFQNDVPVEIMRNITKRYRDINFFIRWADLIKNKLFPYCALGRPRDFIKCKMSFLYGMAFWRLVKKHKINALQTKQFDRFEEALTYGSQYYKKFIK